MREMKYMYFNQRYFSDNVTFCENGSAVLIPEPWLLYDNSIISFLCHVSLSPRLNSLIFVPFKKYWIRNIVRKNFDKSDTVCIIINAHFYHLYYGGIIEIAKQHFDNVKTVFIFSDKVEYFQNHYKDFPNMDSLKRDFDAVITYNIDDHVNYDIFLDRPCFPNYGSNADVVGDYHSDVFFVGKEKGRLDKIYRVFEICHEYGLECDFHITGVEKEQQRYSNIIHFNRQIPYSEVIDRAKRTNCILNIVQDGGSGITLRDYEALSFNKFELTDNVALIETGLYNPNQIIMLEELNERLADIQNGYTGNNNLKEKYSQHNWFKWLEALINETAG